MDEDDTEFKDDSSFEILQISDDEDDYSTSSSLWSSTLQQSFHNVMTDSFPSQLMTESTDNNLKSEFDLKARSMISTISDLPLQFKLQTEPFPITDINAHQNQGTERTFSGDAVSCGSNWINGPVLDSTNFIITLPRSEMIKSPAATEAATTSQYQSIEKTEIFERGESDNLQLAADNSLVKNLSSDKKSQLFDLVYSGNSHDFDNRHLTVDTIVENLINDTKMHLFALVDSENSYGFDDPQSTDDNTLVKNFSSDTDSQQFALVNSEDSRELVSKCNKLALMGRSDCEMLQIYPKRENCSTKLCPVLERGLKISQWVWNHQYVQNLVTGAKSSIRSFFSMLEPEMNSVLGTEDLLIIMIIADAADSKVIEEAFNSSLGGQVVIKRCQIEETPTIPVLPIGHYEAFQALRFRMDRARQLYDPDKKIIMVSTASFVDVYLERWQKGTILCLEDPDLQLNLHNFTSTVPIPNEYIHQTGELTPKDYPLRGKGFALTLEEAIKYTTHIETEDVQELLSGVNHFKSLQLAAEVLAGMYKKYCKRFT